MKTIYIVRAKGVYWKDISYVTDDKQDAIEVCGALAKNDVDDYHFWCVTEHKKEKPRDVKYWELDNITEPIYTTDKSEWHE